MPRMRWPPFWKLEISVPSFEPMSIDEIVLAEPQHLGGLGIEIGEIVAQHLGHAAGVGIFGRENDDGIDGEAKLHQFAFGAVEQRGRKPRLLARHLPDRNHLVHRRHVAERQYGFELSLCPQTWQASTGTLAPLPAARATFVGNTCVGSTWAFSLIGMLMQWIRGAAQGCRWPSTSPASAGAPWPAALAAHSRAWRFSRYPGIAARCRRPERGARPARSRA